MYLRTELWSVKSLYYSSVREATSVDLLIGCSKPDPLQKHAQPPPWYPAGPLRPFGCASSKAQRFDFSPGVGPPGNAERLLRGVRLSEFGVYVSEQLFYHFLELPSSLHAGCFSFGTVAFWFSPSEKINDQICSVFSCFEIWLCSIQSDPVFFVGPLRVFIRCPTQLLLDLRSFRPQLCAQRVTKIASIGEKCTFHT